MIKKSLNFAKKIRFLKILTYVSKLLIIVLQKKNFPFQLKNTNIKYK